MGCFRVGGDPGTFTLACISNASTLSTSRARYAARPVDGAL
jgi:hypothetical protein